MGGAPVGASGLNCVGGEVGPKNSANTSYSNTLDQLEGGAAEGIPNNFFGEGSGESGHGGGKWGVRGGRNILLAVGEAGIGGDAGA